MTPFATTQAESGDITSAAAHCATSSLASRFSGKGAADIEPAKPDDSPVALCSVETAALRWDLRLAHAYIGLLEELLDEKSSTIAALHQQIENFHRSGGQ